ncbi:sensor histidine kinase [Janthinobacterium sp. PC23-8]|uniref:sensor histidine kinase n=1 Tax=Janthinobacterium sp. PC23-8 TaxID=2012679 RepID=UPI000B969307|nr:histidine kinase [Janthinobacterium sp. PC23-8]OYO27789.1 hypothetical protein CD932_21915 [Janthinobacterium sp. PC23-8]
MTSPAMHASFAPLPDPVANDPRLVRLYLKQTLLRFCGGLCLLPMAIVAAGMVMLIRYPPIGDGRHWWQLTLPVLPGLLAPLLGVNGMVRQQLRAFADEGVVLTEELISARVTRELTSPFDIFTTFDLCAEALSGLATGQALGLAGPPAFAHDPFDRIILLGRARPFRLFGATEVRLFVAPGEGVHGVRIRVRRIVSGDFLAMQKGGALRAVEAVTAQLQAGLARRREALYARARGQAAERAALQAKLLALQAQVEPHFLFNTLANLKYLMRTEPAAALTMLDHLTDYLHSALPDLRAVSSTVGRELDLAQAYLSIMQIRMGKRLRFAIEASDTVRALPMPPAMLISLLENAVKHGLEGWPHPGTVRIEACLEEGMLALRVQDDGAGFGGSAAQGAGLGLSNIHTRLALLYGGAASLAVAEGEAGGVSACLHLPLAMPAARAGA